MIDTNRLCKRDGFPMVKIKGRWECACEYLDRCIGGEKIVDIVQRGKTFYYVFESGHELPLLCSCCDTPLLLKDLEGSRKRMCGRRLKWMSLVPFVSPEGEEGLQFFLEFSSKGILWWRRIADPISPRAAARMRHPDSCPHR